MVKQTLLKTSDRYVDRTLRVHRLRLKTVEMRSHHTRWKEKLQLNRNAALMRKHGLTSEGSGGPTAVYNNGPFAVAIFRRLLSAASDDNMNYGKTGRWERTSDPSPSYEGAKLSGRETPGSHFVSF